jgi:ABC-2 type transport system ATP-binding protein
MSAVPLIEIDRLQKRFGTVEVLKGVDVDILEGEIFGFLGTNGAGKSTTINILTNQITADSGTIKIAGMPASTESNRLIGLAPQDIALYPHLSARENLNFFAGVYGMRGAARHRHVARVLDGLELRSMSNIEVEKLSGGWQRRLNLAIALVHQPRIAILDESTVGMDVEARFNMWDTIRALKTDGVTVVLTTHLMDEAEALCDRIGILHDGRIAALGTMDELRDVVPAVELAEVECSDMQLLMRHAEASGFVTRHYAGRLTLLLPKQLTIGDLIERLAPLEIQSARLRAISLSDVFLEITSTA